VEIMDDNEFHQRQPLLLDPDSSLELEENGVTSHNNSPRIRNGSAVKIEIGMAPERVISTKFPKEYWKTFTALCFVLCNFLLTTVSLSVTHELRRPEQTPLPDITLDHIPYRRWALDVSEVFIMISTITAAFFVVFHKYRLILIRRVCVIVGLLYGYRAVTMIVTVLPSANREYHCDSQLNHTITSAEVLHRVVKIMSGFGLSINGNHVFCGDFIFSGHTMILVLCYLIIVEYTPKKLWLVHWLVLGVAVGGVAMLMSARGHYSIDVIVAYFVTTRLWYIQHSVIHNRVLQQESSTNYLSRLWWWRLTVWYEENVRAPLPYKFEIPKLWVTSLQAVSSRTRTRDPSRDI